MFHNGYDWRLTKHGRARFLERVGICADTVMLITAIQGKEGYTFIWAPDRVYPTQGRRLVTVLIKKDEVIV